MRLKQNTNIWASVLFLLALISSPFCYADHRLCVGSYSSASQTRWVILGIQNLSPGGISISRNLTEMGFQGNDLRMDPGFLLEVNDQIGIHHVYSFKLETLSGHEIQNAPQSSSLPPLLLDIPNAQRDERNHTTGVIFSALGKTLPAPFSTAVAVPQVFISKYRENQRKLQAYYLLELIYQALSPANIFPEFIESISPDRDQAKLFLKKLGEALLVRYDPQSNYKGTHVPTEDEGRFFEKWCELQSKARNNNRGYFNRHINQSGLRTLSMGEDFALVFIKTDIDSGPAPKEHYQRKFGGLGSSKRGPKEIVESITSLEYEEANLVPWYVVSFANLAGPVDLANFPFPQNFVKKLKSLRNWEAIRQIAGSLLPLSYWMTQGTQKIIEYHAYRHEHMKYLDRLPAFGSVLALAETHAHLPNDDSIAQDEIAWSVFRDALQSFHIRSDFNFKKQDLTYLLNEITARLVSEAEYYYRFKRSLTKEELEQLQEAHIDRFINYFRTQTEHDLEISKRKGKEKDEGPSRGPSSITGPSRSPSSNGSRKPFILFMIDGLRPDRFKQALEQGHLPHLSALFKNRGTQVESYVSRSLTLPSWSTILTGYEPDTHGIRSNTPTSRLERNIISYQDPRKDLLEFKNWQKNRAFQRLEQDHTGQPGKVWLFDYFTPDEVVYNYMPIVSGAQSAAEEVIKDFIKKRRDLIEDTLFLPSLIDLASAENTAQLIHKDARAGKKLYGVANWYASNDEGCHYENRSLPTVFKNLDHGMGLILEAAAKHPHLKDATVIVLSDHGHTAGFGPFDQTSTIYQAKNPSPLINGEPLLIHTGFNLTEFFGGKYYGYERYLFNRVAEDRPEPQFKEHFLQEFQLQPFSYHSKEHRDRTDVLIDASGNNLAQLYIKGRNDPNWERRLNYYELSHFQTPAGKSTLNIPLDLLNLKLPDLMVTDPSLRRQIALLSHNEPVGLLALALAGKAARESADTLGATAETGPSTREPVLVIAKDHRPGKGPMDFNTSLILTRTDSYGNDEFRYIVVRNFYQSQDGRIYATISTDSGDDPLGYLLRVEDAYAFFRWKTDRMWLDAAKNHPQPTAIFSLPRALTLAPKFTEASPSKDSSYSVLSKEVQKLRQGEIPDLLLVANPGYAFHVDAPLESDHGGLAREEVRNSFFISSLNPVRFRRSQILSVPVLNRDFMPTLLEYAGFESHQIPRTQGISFKPLIDAAYFE